MAATIVSAASQEIESLIASLSGGGTSGIVGRIAASALGGVAASTIINALKGATPSTKAKVPRYGLVDLHTDTIITTMGTRRAYRFLIRPRRRAIRSRITREIIHERDGRERV